MFLFDSATALCFSFRRWARGNEATALTETVILFPVLLALMMGCFDIGQGIILNQKTISASQAIADLVARQRNVDMLMMEDIIKAGELALEPHSLETFGYDIVSVAFDSAGRPDVLWRLTDNMSPNHTAVQSTEVLGGTGEGVVVVTVVYTYRPFFSNFIREEINMREVAFLRGRRSATVTCPDCPA